MKILIVSQYFWPENFRITDLGIGLAEQGYEVTVLTGKPNYPRGSFFKGYGFFSQTYEKYGPIRIIRVPLIPRGRGGGARLALNYFSFAFFGCLLAPWVYRDRPDVILSYQTSPITAALPAILLKWLRKVSLVMWVQDLWPESLSATGAVRSPVILKWVGKMVRWIYQKCDLILMQSEAFRSSILAHGARPDSLRYVPNFAEDLYSSSSVSISPPECADLPKGFKILFAGNVGAAQDFNCILEAASLTKERTDIQWIIVGDGRLMPWVRVERSRRGLEKTVHLLGRFPVERMPEFFTFADVMLATLRDEPIFDLTVPSKIQSYLAFGKPILAALNGEGARVIEHARAGVSVSAGNAEQLAKAAIELSAKSAAELEAMGQRGREFYETAFSRSQILGIFKSLFDEVKAGS